jgi:uncharacterized membrane protein YbhN (UPF0104 family)
MIERTPGRRRAASLVLRAAVSLSILAVILPRVSRDALALRLSETSFVELAVVWLLFVGMALLAALRWRILARWLGLPLPARLAVRAVFLGLFGGQILPSSIGSDIARGWVVGRQTGRIGVVAASIAADRLAGFCGASFLLGFAYAFVVQAEVSLPALVVFAAALASAAILLILLAGCAGWLEGLRKSAAALFRPAGSWQRAEHGCAPVALALAIALAIHATATVAAALAADAYGIQSSLATWLPIVPVAVIAAALPVSINGWGVREGVVVALGAGYGLGAADALLVSLTLGLANMLASLPAVYFLLREPPHDHAPG